MGWPVRTLRHYNFNSFRRHPAADALSSSKSVHLALMVSNHRLTRR